MLSPIPAVDLTIGDRLAVDGHIEQLSAITPILERPGCMWVWTRQAAGPHLFLPGDTVHVERHWTDGEIKAIDEAVEAGRRRWQLLAAGGWDPAAIRAAERRLGATPHADNASVPVADIRPTA